MRLMPPDIPGSLMKIPTWRSEPYLALVRALPCMCCGIHGRTQPAHSNQSRFGKGRSLKASDASAMALCAAMYGKPGCHDTHDQGGTRTRLQAQEFEYKHICRTITTLIRMKKLTGSFDVLLKADPSPLGDYETHAVYLISLLESGELKVAK